ncbi:MAG: hypothetical protein D3924_12675 [Candidatus Electrothrix sp. AR4]|nr:hypothetical protein [Candidatus Electrothrix sp. AR4]
MTKYDIDTLEGRLTVPISTSCKTYTSAFFETLHSEQAATRNYDDMRYLFGAQWAGPYRVSIWVEGGYENITYEADDHDVAGIIGETGVNVIFTPRSSLELSLGRNGYGKLKYAGMIQHNYEDKLDIRLSADRHTAKSFSSLINEASYEVNALRLSLRTNFMEKIIAGVKGSYQFQNHNESIETWVGRASLNYPIQDWITTGGYYQYSVTEFDDKTREYNDGRIGIFVIFSI